MGSSPRRAPILQGRESFAKACSLYEAMLSRWQHFGSCMAYRLLDDALCGWCLTYAIGGGIRKSHNVRKRDLWKQV